MPAARGLLLGASLLGSSLLAACLSIPAVPLPIGAAGDGGDVDSHALDGSAVDGFVSPPPEAGTVVVLAQGQANPWSIAADVASVYWTNQTNNQVNSGTVMKCAAGGCGGNPSLIANNQVGPQAIAVGASH